MTGILNGPIVRDEGILLWNIPQLFVFPININGIDFAIVTSVGKCFCLSLCVSVCVRAHEH